MNITLKTSISIVLASVFISGCAELPQNMNKMSETLTNIGKGKFGTTKFEQAGLANLLKNSDDPNGWPRVALVIEDMPPDAGTIMYNWVMPPGYCITLSATVWKSAKVSQQLNSIPFCSADINNGHINSFSDVAAWARFPHNSVKNTGNTRTNGPTPPLRAFPTVRSVIVDSAATKGAAMFGGLLYSMGLDLSVDSINDTRVWVVKTAR